MDGYIILTSPPRPNNSYALSRILEAFLGLRDIFTVFVPLRPRFRMWFHLEKSTSVVVGYRQPELGVSPAILSAPDSSSQLLPRQVCRVIASQSCEACRRAASLFLIHRLPYASTPCSGFQPTYLRVWWKEYMTNDIASTHLCKYEYMHGDGFLVAVVRCALAILRPF